MAEQISFYNKTHTTPSAIRVKKAHQDPIAPNAPIEEETKTSQKPQLNKLDVAAVCTAVLGLATASACVIKSANKDKAFEKMKETLLFPDGIEKINFRQSNIADCYLLSPIFGLSRNKKGQELLKNMVQINDKGEFIVKFKGQKPITVLPSQLKGQCISDENKVKRTVYGDMGLQAIECAYGKYRKQLAINTNPNTLSLKAIDFGKPSDALRVLGGFDATNIGDLTKGSLKGQNYGVKKALDDIADNFENTIACACTPNKAFAKSQKNICGTTQYFMDKNQKFCCGHTYNISGIDKLNKKVKIVNPHNTQKEYELSYDDFSKLFGRITKATI